MAWKIEFDKAVEKDFKKIGPQAQREIIHYLKHRVADSEDPTSFGKPLRGKLSGLWRYRVGNYRVITRIYKKDVIILVVKVGHRKNIY